MKSKELYQCQGCGFIGELSDFRIPNNAPTYCPKCCFEGVKLISGSLETALMFEVAIGLRRGGAA